MNFLSDEPQERVRAAYGSEKHERLAAWKTYDALMKEMREYQEAHEPERPRGKLTSEELERRRIEVATVSFAAAALFLYIDLDMPGVRDEKPYRLAEHNPHKHRDAQDKGAG